MRSLYETLNKSSARLPKGDNLRVELSRVPAVLLRLLRINASSPRGDKISQADFNSFLGQLQLLHSWAVNRLTEFMSFSPASIIPFVPELSDVLAHMLESKDALVIVDALLLVWAEPMFSGICKHLGRKISALVLKSLSSAANADNIKLASLLSKLLKDVSRSGLPLSVADALFELAVAIMVEVPNQPVNIFTDEYQSTLVECLIAGTVGSVPFYLSSRSPLVLKMITMLSAYSHTGRKTIRACINALEVMEVAIHPVKALPPIETATRLKRVESVRSVLEEISIVGMDSTDEVVPFSTASFKTELNISALNAISELDEVPTAFSMVANAADPLVTSHPHAPQVLSAPNVLMKLPVASDNAVIDEDDEPLPELFLD
jgi:hypothetical protein